MKGDLDLLMTPWVRGGRRVLEGLDCYGLVIEKACRLGIHFPDVWADSAALRKLWDDATSDAVEHRPEGFELVESGGELRPGDVLVFGHGEHLAIVDEKGYVLQTRRKHGPNRVPVQRIRHLVRSAWRWVR